MLLTTQLSQCAIIIGRGVVGRERSEMLSPHFSREGTGYAPISIKCM